MTPKQRDLLVYIAKYQAEHQASPSFDEMMDHLGLHSKSGPHRMLTALREQGLILRQEHRARRIIITDEGIAALSNGVICPICKRAMHPRIP